MYTLEEMALRLREAEEKKEGIRPLTDLMPSLTPEEAYEIQLINIRRRISQGERVVGKKIGLTSKAMQHLLGVNEPDYGHLLDTMEIEAGSRAPWEKLLQPKVEGELAFILKERLKGPGVTTLDVIKAVDQMVPSIEIVDSRIRDWKIKLPDTIADNASSGLFLLGKEKVPLRDVDVTEIGMALYVNDTLVNTGVGAAALGNPLYSVAWLANFLGRFDIPLEAGEVVLSGALSAAVEVHPGDRVKVEFADLETLTVQF
ncbi:2-hydroxyhexa-2,4-dienoate hydratase [[Clostridium] ultunense Esp]|uniref:2-keto-4-pentenoate hydratase n=1 Tax=Thermicanus aegyptius TaxID=94009 RepID=UPI0002B6FC08|nr:fumarylacetoacetate hydrolase family protein [Thermicanus aegyptius]CCQ97456.1 2-hydroxyhexa-2,4-dienoate hydratase [[Clostridium] ultunense Esp]